MLQNSAFIKYKLHHLLFWLVLFGGWYYFRYQDYREDTAFIITLVKIIELATTVYITNYVLIPKFIYRKKYLLFTSVFVLMITTSSLLKLQVIINILGSTQSIFTNFKARVYDNVIPHFLLVSTGAAFKLLLDYAKAQKQIAIITKEKSQAELNFLKSQINPHFVFNSLNSIYFLIDKNNTDARNVLHKFSNMLRFQLYELNGARIPIEKEIKYLEDYVDLQKLRQDKCTVSFTRSDNLLDFTIEPLLLIPFVENAFKHLSHYDDNRVNIEMSKVNGELKFCISNTAESDIANDVVKSGGIGLANIKRRLELLYGGKHNLDIDERDGWYNVQLTLYVE